MSTRMEQAGQVLHDVFGFGAFRGDQSVVLEAIFSDRNALLIMPTGMGKSLCFQIPARVFAQEGLGLTIVISPLIALMKDQVDAANAKGLRACFINSSLTGEERKNRYRRLARGDYELIYVTPERFRIPEFLEAVAANRVALLAIDEAHCISAWGHDFRPDYSRVGDIRAKLQDPLTIAMTATATPLVRQDIVKQLRIESSVSVFNRGVRRENLAISVVNVHGMDEKVRAFVAYRYQNPGPVIVYFSLIQTLRKFSDEISRLGISHLCYHGQLNDRERRHSQDAFLKSPDAIILATPAFGLGIDKDNVRMVMHGEIAGSIEAYYQEIGRAGRDAAQSECVLLYDEDDVSIQADFLKWSNPDPGFIQAVYNLIERNLTRARQEGFDYLRTQMNFYNRRDFRVESSVNQLERWGSLEGRNPRDWTPVQSPPSEYLEQKDFESRSRGVQRKLYEMLSFAQMTAGCRMIEIEKYFAQGANDVSNAQGANDRSGEHHQSSNFKRCGICDHCLEESADASAKV